jgi:uracil-DNA glycosylase family 4
MTETSHPQSNLTSLPNTYNGNQHPLLKFNKECNACALGKGCAVGGAGPDDFNNLKLVVISDSIGEYESLAGYPMYDNYKERMPKYNKKTKRHSLPGWKNAGATLREYLSTLFGLNTYTQVWITNAVKCSPQEIKVSDIHIKSCNFWLKEELELIDYIKPEVPILIAGTSALKAIHRIDPALKPFKSLRVTRRQVLHWRLHPIVTTVNPAVIGRSEARIESPGSVGLTPQNTYKINAVDLFPALIGSPAWNFSQDLELLRPFIV